MKKVLAVMALFALVLSMAACAGKDGKDKASAVPVADIIIAIKEQIAKDMEEQYDMKDTLVDGVLDGYVEADLTEMNSEDPLVTMHQEKMELKEDELAEGIVLAPMMGLSSNEIIVLKAADGTHVDSLKAALERELAAQTTSWESYLPDQYEKVKNNIIKTSGNYLLYVTYDDPEKIEKIFDEKVK